MAEDGSDLPGTHFFHENHDAIRIHDTFTRRIGWDQPLGHGGRGGAAGYAVGAKCGSACCGVVDSGISPLVGITFYCLLV